MSDKSAIEWTDATWNPIRATEDGVLGRHYCERISPGCDHCYAATMTRRLAGYSYPSVGDAGEPGAKVAGVAPVLDQKALQLPLTWKEPRRIFVCSMTDIAGEWVPFEWFHALMTVMAETPRHTYQVLTKRPARLKEYVERFYADAPGFGPFPLPNVWLGVTIEDDRYAWRAKVLSEIPAAVRWVSAEPLLGPLPSLDLGEPIAFTSCGMPRGPMAVETADAFRNMVHAAARHIGHRPKIDWLVAGGQGARAMELDWVRDLRDRCRESGTAVFVKQMGTVWARQNSAAGSKGDDWDKWPVDLRVRKYPEARHAALV